MHLWNSLVNVYAKCGSFGYACKVLDRMPERDVVSWTALFSGLVNEGYGYDVLGLYCFMKKDGVLPNGHCLVTALKACSLSLELFFGTLLHGEGVKVGVLLDVFVGSSLVDLYAKCGEMELAERVFVYMDKKNVVSWNALLNGYTLKGDAGKVLNLFQEMTESELRCTSWNALLSRSHDDKACDQGPTIFHKMLAEGFRPDICTFTSILRSCSGLLNIKFGQQVHVHIIKNGLNDNNLVGTSLIDLYAKNRFLEDAELLFSQLIERDIFSWTALITGYAQTDRLEKAIKCFNQMQRQGVKPNEFTLATSLSICSKMATLENGQLLHSMAIKAGHLSDQFVSCAIVDMYANCGCIEEAEAAFQGMGSADIVSWNAMLFGYLGHGLGLKVLETFRMMLGKGLEPDEVTFISVLSACSYMGLVGEGKEHFGSLTNVYGIVPTIEHYACMIDILGRAGKFDEVESFILDTKVRSNPLIWETVLGACRRHGNDKFGESAAEKLFELDPGTASHYILLANIFAAKGRWEDVRRVRALMTSRGVKKEPGCSWVMVNGQLHIFKSADGSHPKSREIYIKLKELVEKVILAGYVPKTEHILHNVSNDEKVEQLFYHNERLAFAFALISINPVKTIRIFKNLRICEDCHDFMKLVSGIIKQEIVVRDVNCFHHFRSGICSCQD
ncbi:hypothetical protein REPUB_Repub05bG0023100 [Reevesia pubescens]